MPERFKYGIFILKMHRVFSIHTTLKKMCKWNFGFLLEENSGRKLYYYCIVIFFKKLCFEGVFSPHLKSHSQHFQIPSIWRAFSRKALFSWRISLDSRIYLTNKAVFSNFSNFSSMVWTGPWTQSVKLCYFFTGYMLLAGRETMDLKCQVMLFFTGYMLLAGRCRNPLECKVIKEVIEIHMKRKLDSDMLFGDATVKKHSTGLSGFMTEVTTASLEEFKHIVWTYNMRRLAVLAGRALQFGEPVLLVGETGYCNFA